MRIETHPTGQLLFPILKVKTKGRKKKIRKLISKENIGCAKWYHEPLNHSVATNDVYIILGYFERKILKMYIYKLK